eukprot:c7216_g1_i1 orf=3-161(-)
MNMLSPNSHMHTQPGFQACKIYALGFAYHHEICKFSLLHLQYAHPQLSLSLSL